MIARIRRGSEGVTKQSTEISERKLTHSVLLTLERLFMLLLICLLIGMGIVNSGLLGQAYVPISRVGGAVRIDGTLYVARFGPAAVFRYDREFHLMDITPANVSPIELHARDGRVVVSHSGNELKEHPLNGSIGEPVTLRRNLIGQIYVWDEERARWIALQKPWITIFQFSWPSVPIWIILCGAAALAHFA